MKGASCAENMIGTARSNVLIEALFHPRPGVDSSLAVLRISI